jgi:hypothetical protein
MDVSQSSLPRGNKVELTNRPATIHPNIIFYQKNHDSKQFNLSLNLVVPSLSLSTLVLKQRMNLLPCKRFISFSFKSVQKMIAMNGKSTREFNTSTTVFEKTLTIDKVNRNIRDTEYAVRGELAIRADALKQVNSFNCL